MKVQKNGNTVEVDIHGLRAEDAKARLLHLIENVPPDTAEIVVIHGYSRGTALMDMVRGELSHPRIKSKLKSMNEGQTRLILKKIKSRMNG